MRFRPAPWGVFFCAVSFNLCAKPWGRAQLEQKCDVPILFVESRHHGILWRADSFSAESDITKGQHQKQLLFLTFEVKIAPFFLRGAPPRTPGLALRS